MEGSRKGAGGGTRRILAASSVLQAPKIKLLDLSTRLCKSSWLPLCEAYEIREQQHMRTEVLQFCGVLAAEACGGGSSHAHLASGWMPTRPRGRLARLLSKGTDGKHV